MNKKELKEWAQDEILAFAQNALLALDQEYGLSQEEKEEKEKEIQKQLDRVKRLFNIVV